MEIYKGIIDSLNIINSKNGSSEISINNFEPLIGCMNISFNKGEIPKSFLLNLNKSIRLGIIPGSKENELSIIVEDEQLTFFVLTELLRNFCITNIKEEDIYENVLDSLDKYHTICSERFEQIQKDISVAVVEHFGLGK